ncbi:MAG: YtxH domain-containing protein [Rikenellaceae bacterium]|nr:YtxH domain-containing protein [Rikenellaceae bacterium]
MKGSNVLTFIVGALAGASIAMLFAPQSGKDTRKKIKGAMEDEYHKIAAKVCRGQQELADKIEEKINGKK